MVIFLLAWLVAALILVAIDVRARFAGQERGAESIAIWLGTVGLVAFSAFWFTR